MDIITNWHDLKVGQTYSVDSPFNGFFFGELIEPFSEKAPCIFFKVKRWYTKSNGEIVAPLWKYEGSEKTEYIDEDTVKSRIKSGKNPNNFKPIYKVICEQKKSLPLIKIRA